MMKKLICIVISLVLMVGISSKVYAEDTKTANQSVELMYARLQLQMANDARDKSIEKMETIDDYREKQQKASDYLKEARQCANEAEEDDKEVEISKDMADYLKVNDLEYSDSGNDMKLNAQEWDGVVSSFENHIEELGQKCQMEMVYLQDFIGQYNSYLLGANQGGSSANQTIKSLARGQSMYGDSQVGIILTVFVLGIVLGCALILVIQKVSGKKDNA